MQHCLQNLNLDFRTNVMQLKQLTADRSQQEMSTTSKIREKISAHILFFMDAAWILARILKYLQSTIQIHYCTLNKLRYDGPDGGGAIRLFISMAQDVEKNCLHCTFNGCQSSFADNSSALRTVNSKATVKVKKVVPSI